TALRIRGRPAVGGQSRQSADLCTKRRAVLVLLGRRDEILQLRGRRWMMKSLGHEGADRLIFGMSARAGVAISLDEIPQPGEPCRKGGVDSGRSANDLQPFP